MLPRMKEDKKWRERTDTKEICLVGSHEILFIRNFNLTGQ